MGAGASLTFNQHDAVYRLQLNEFLDDVCVQQFLLKSFPDLVTTSADNRYTASPNIVQIERALFWYIRLRFRNDKLTRDARLAVSYAKGEDTGIFQLDYAEVADSAIPPAIPTDLPYLLSVESAELTSLDPVVPLMNQCCLIGNFSNNHLGNKDIEKYSSELIQSNLRVLQLGGNRIRKLANLMNIMPINLLVLDLSFMDNLELSVDCFKSCFRLLRLVMDNCGLNATTIVDPVKGTQSMFHHLYCLEDLSLRENNFDSITSLSGLSVFGRVSIPALDGEISTLAFGRLQSGATLKNINLADNPICEISALYKDTLDIIREQIPSLACIDDKPIYSTVGQTINMTTLSRMADSGGGVSGTNQYFDAVDAEFVSALRGEKDNTVVS